MADPILIETDDRGVATVTLNRPEKHNALDDPTIAALSAAAARLGRDPAVRVVVLTGAGASFCAGADLGWMQAQIDATPRDRAAAAMRLAEMLGKLNTLKKPLIGRINGNAFGGGLGLASVCDVALTVEGARFGFTETRLGLIPATIGPYVLARIGEAMARRVFFSARLFDAAEAVTLGLAAQALPPEALDAAIAAEVTPYLSCAPGAVAEAKALARQFGPRIDEAAIALSVEALVARWESPEAAEGIRAFFAKDRPSWVAPRRRAEDRS